MANCSVQNGSLVVPVDERCAQCQNC